MESDWLRERAKLTTSPGTGMSGVGRAAFVVTQPQITSVGLQASTWLTEIVVTPGPLVAYGVGCPEAVTPKAVRGMQVPTAEHGTSAMHDAITSAVTEGITQKTELPIITTTFVAL